MQAGIPPPVVRVRQPPSLPEAWASQLQLESKMGGGSFGTVHSARVSCTEGWSKVPRLANPDTFWRTQVSVKVMHSGKRSDKEEQYREVKFLRMMRGVDYVVSSVGMPDHVET